MLFEKLKTEKWSVTGLEPNTMSLQVQFVTNQPIPLQHLWYVKVTYYIIEGFVLSMIFAYHNKHVQSGYFQRIVFL